VEFKSQILNSMCEADILELVLSAAINKNDIPLISIKKLAEDYEQHVEQTLSAAYLKSIKLSLKHLKNYFGENKLLSQIDLKCTEEFIHSLKESAPKGYQNYYRDLKAAFNKAVSWGYTRNNPFTNIKLAKVQKNSPVIITEDELNLIQSTISNDVIKDIILFAYYTGLRIGEIVNLSWSSVKLDERIIAIGSEEFSTKTREQRHIPVNETVFNLLSKYINKVTSIKRRLVFTKPNGYQYCSGYVSKTFKKACRKAGLSEAIHFHSLRHSFASQLVKKGIPLYTVKELMGHSSIKTTEIYSHLDMKTLREAVDKLNGVQMK
jgi:site-specific recombinase XerD